MNRPMKVNDKFPNWMTSGGTTPESYTGFISNVVYPYFYAQDRPVFRYSYSFLLFPSITVGTNAQWLSSLDVMFAMKYGERTLRRIVEPFKLHNNADEELTDEEKRNTVILAQMINERFGDKWNRIAEALADDYNPLENYNRIEESVITDDGGKDGNNTRSFDNYKNEKTTEGGWKDNDTRGTTKGGKVKTERDTHNRINGFDGQSAEGVPSDNQHIVETIDYAPNSDDYTEQNSGDLTRSYQNYKETEKPTGKILDDYTETNGNERNINTNIHGNIGVMSSQNMLEQELAVRRNILWDIVLADIAEFLTLSIY